MLNVVQCVFVAWQNPFSRRYFPVARLATVANGEPNPLFEFAYIRGALSADGFEPFVSFPKFDDVAWSDTLFPMFTNRMLSPRRPDYPEHLAHLGLPDASAPLTILARSGGSRATDSLQLFAPPEFDEQHGYRTWFWAHGMRYLSPASRDRLLLLRFQEPVHASPEPDNPADKQAIQLLSDDGIPLGYMPAWLLEDAHNLAQQCGAWELRVEQLNLPPAPLQHRLLVRWDACWPTGFAPYTSDRYQPINPDAASRSDAAALGLGSPASSP
jgi:hypothetical protein